MVGRKDALTDVAQALQGQGTPTSSKPSSTPSNLSPNQAVARDGNVVNLGFSGRRK
jgi:hypothetical protein